MNWENIETVMLDMDGTLLDLHFDNYFWQEYLPQHWGKLNDMDVDSAKAILIPKFKSIEGTLAWYCLDYWSEELELDVFQLKYDVEHLISIRPSVLELLSKLNEMGKEVMLVTNAHEKILDVKLEKTQLKKYFDQIISAHVIGHPKEHNEFWQELSSKVIFDNEKTLFIDDNHTVLETAKKFGIAHLRSIRQPDSQLPARTTNDFQPIGDFIGLF